MPKRAQKIVLFIEPSDLQYDTPSKIGNLFMNRLAIDEDESNEILKIFHLEEASSFPVFVKGLSRYFP